jgi:hypothetical protein
MILNLEFYNGDRDSLVEVEVAVDATRETSYWETGSYSEINIEGFDVLSVTEALSDGEVLDLGRKVPAWISYDDIMTEIEFADWG